MLGRMKKWMLVLALLTSSCGRGYSEGNRAGTVSKFSQKGMIWKSWEGEMVLGGIREQGDANLFKFTVTNPKLVEAVERSLESGERARLSYVQWIESPMSMESDYEIVGVSQ